MRSTASPQWFNDQVSDAFEQSNELVLETLVPEEPQPIASWHATPASRAAVTPSASFLATTRMAINAGRSQGMQVGNGADMVLRHVAEAEGKPVEGLETLQFQLDMFTRMPATPAPRRRAAGRPVGASSMDSLSKAMAEMQAAWKRGDQSVFVRMLEQLKQASPDTYRMMFTERNARWADWIRPDADARARCSSRSAPAISPARTACSSGSPSAASPRSGSTDAPPNLLFRAPSLRGARSPAMVIPGGVAGSFANGA